MIDVKLDLRVDAGGYDPDRHSRALRQYNQELWVGDLPWGGSISVMPGRRGDLQYTANEKTLPLSSDTIATTFKWFGRMQPFLQKVGVERVDEFQTAIETIGARLVFPSRRIERRPTINGARGMNRLISDRFDLTLECIRRHYEREASPLSLALARYEDFFAAFGDFDGYVHYFLLEDHLDSGAVRFYLPFSGDFYARPARPRHEAEYDEYRLEVLEVLAARNARIQARNAGPSAFIGPRA